MWAIKDKSIVSAFVDAGAAKFLMPQLSAEAEASTGPSKRMKYQLNGRCEPLFPDILVISSTTELLSVCLAINGLQHLQYDFQFINCSE